VRVLRPHLTGNSCIFPKADAVTSGVFDQHLPLARDFGNGKPANYFFSVGTEAAMLICRWSISRLKLDETLRHALGSCAQEMCGRLNVDALMSRWTKLVSDLCHPV
jgi:hypothetical protein